MFFIVIITLQKLLTAMNMKKVFLYLTIQTHRQQSLGEAIVVSLPKEQRII